jgi:hypothetical protein
MGGRFSAVFALALVALAGCASTGSKVRGGPGSTVQLVVPEAVAWEPGDDFIVPVTVFNATKMMLQIAQPGDDSVEFTLYKPDGSRACGSPRVTWHQVEPFRIQRVRPLTGMPYKAKFDAYCQDLASGVYRYDISYHASSPSDSFTDAVWTGQLGPLSGRVLLRSGARGLKYEELLAAFEAKEGSPEATAVAAAADAAAAAEAASTPGAAGDPAAVRACVDKELAARKLNAYGDPAGTQYANGPPTDEYGRVLYVASRFSAIRKVCGISGF